MHVNLAKEIHGLHRIWTRTTVPCQIDLSNLLTKNWLNFFYCTVHPLSQVVVPWFTPLTTFPKCLFELLSSALIHIRYRTGVKYNQFLLTAVYKFSRNSGTNLFSRGWGGGGLHSQLMERRRGWLNLGLGYHLSLIKLAKRQYYSQQWSFLSFHKRRYWRGPIVVVNIDLFIAYFKFLSIQLEITVQRNLLISIQCLHARYQVIF
jgi:hypothetical protein